MNKIAFVASFLIFLCGCSSNPKDRTYTGKDGVTYREDNDIQGVWLAHGFDFNGYDSVVVTEPDSDASSRSDEEKQVLQTARRTLRNELVAALEGTQLFKKIVLATNEIPAGSKTLILENNIYHHEKGGGGARYFAGFAGAGQPVIKINGKMSDNGQPLFRYEISRSGESAGSRLAGVWMSDETIQTEDIRDLARDLASFIKSTATHTPRK